MRNSTTRNSAPRKSRNYSTARHGVAVVDGYGIAVRVERGRLVVADGIGAKRQERRYARVGHGLRRLVVMGHSGSITLEALRWMHRVGIAFAQIDTDGELLTASAAIESDDARLRRAQALAATTDTALGITTQLLDAKLAGQATVARNKLHAPSAAERIDALRRALHDATTISESREIEAEAAAYYFNEWPDRVALRWANNDRPRVPEHWTRYGGRRSPLTSGSANRAADPTNALLNYLYALAEFECRLACLTLGLDPGLGFLHADAKARDSLALDLIEVARPHIDAYVIDLADHHTFKREDFTERDDGHCRVLPPLTHQLIETLPQWEAAVAPHAEAITHTLADNSKRSIRKHTPLTSAVRRRAATESSTDRLKRDPTASGTPETHTKRVGPLRRVCPDCGEPINHHQRVYCADCWPKRRAAAAHQGSAAARLQLTTETQRKARSQAVSAGKQQARANRAAAQGLSDTDYRTRIGPKVRKMTLRQITEATGLSISHASRIKTGKQIPDPKHWAALAAAYQADDYAKGRSVTP